MKFTFYKKMLLISVILAFFLCGCYSSPSSSAESTDTGVASPVADGYSATSSITLTGLTVVRDSLKNQFTVNKSDSRIRIEGKNYNARDPEIRSLLDFNTSYSIDLFKDMICMSFSSESYQYSCKAGYQALAFGSYTLTTDGKTITNKMLADEESDVCNNPFSKLTDEQIIILCNEFVPYLQ